MQLKIRFSQNLEKINKDSCDISIAIENTRERKKMREIAKRKMPIRLLVWRPLFNTICAVLSFGMFEND